MGRLTEILRNADLALAQSLRDDPIERLGGMIEFMRSFEVLAREIHSTHESWDPVRLWAAGVAGRVQAADRAFDDWQLELGDLLYGASRNEEEVEAAFYRRSQYAFAREAFRDTPVDALLARAEDAEFDRDLREAAERLDVFAPSYVPRSHTWWLPRSE